MAPQPSWSSTPNAGAPTVQDAFQRNLLMRYGGRTDSIWDYQDFEGYKRELGSPSSASNGTWVNNIGSGSVKLQGMGGGTTTSDPGGYNYRTLANTAGMTGQLLGTAANFAMDRMPGADPQLDFRFGNTPIYTQYRGKKERAERIKAQRARKMEQQQLINRRVEAAQQLAAKKSQAAGISNVAKKAQETSQMLQPPVQGPPAPGTKPQTSSPVRRPRFNAEVDLLTTNRFPSVAQTTSSSVDPMDIWGTTSTSSGPSTYNMGASEDNFWSRVSNMGDQQGESIVSDGQQTSGRPTGAAGASQRPNQPRNRGRGPRNRGFGKRL